MALPSLVSNSDPRTPLNQRDVRRNTRLSATKKGFRPVRIEKEPSKRTKNWVVQIDEETREVGPLSVETLQVCGLKCSVDPGDLTEDALLQAPSATVADDEDTE
jgi:hypothetical protein